MKEQKQMYLMCIIGSENNFYNISPGSMLNSWLCGGLVIDFRGALLRTGARNILHIFRHAGKSKMLETSNTSRQVRVVLFESPGR